LEIVRTIISRHPSGSFVHFETGELAFEFVGVQADHHRNEPRVGLGSGAANRKVMAYFLHEQRQTEAREEEA
jgi:hypothetical protein